MTDRPFAAIDAVNPVMTLTALPRRHHADDLVIALSQAVGEAERRAHGIANLDGTFGYGFALSRVGCPAGRRLSSQGAFVTAQPGSIAANSAATFTVAKWQKVSETA